MSEKKFELLQAFRTKEIFQTGDSIEHLFEPKQFESETHFEISTKKIKNDMYDVTLTVHLKTREAETKDSAYQVTVSYTGLFEIQGLSDEDFEKAIRTHSSMMLYPYCRAAINGIISDSTFPNATIPSINFFAIFEEQLKQRTEKEKNPEVKEELK